MWSKKKNTLADIRAYLEAMGNPDDSMKLLHVAGTNGKGSVCAMLTSILAGAGYRVGTFVSPHLLETRERIELEGRPVSPPLFEEGFLEVKRLSDQMVRAGYCAPTYFEFLFYMGMEIFKEEKPDYVILETGLGGRLDATNVIRSPLLTVITSISLDHMEYLGDTVEKIAAEKAGIIKPGVPVVYDGNCREAAGVIAGQAFRLGSFACPVCREDWEITGRDKGFTRAELPFAFRQGRMEFFVRSEADYQVMNAALALRAAEMLRNLRGCAISGEAMSSGIRRMCWPGRMEAALPGVYLDGAHNAGGIGAFTEAAQRICRESGKRAWLLFAAVSDKEYRKMIRKLCLDLDIKGAVVARMHTERGLEAETLAAEFEAAGCPVTVFDTVRAAVDYALSARAEDLLFCVGSLYLIGEVKAAMAAAQAERQRPS